MAASVTAKDALAIVDSMRAYDLYAAQQTLEKAIAYFYATEALNKTLRSHINASDNGVRQKASQELKRALKHRITTLVPQPQDIPLEGGMVCKVQNRDPKKIKFELGAVLDAMRMCEFPDDKIQMMQRLLFQLATQHSLKSPLTVKIEQAGAFSAV